MRSFVIPAVLIAATACGGGSSPAEEIKLAYPHAKVGTHSLADKECMTWSGKDDAAKTVKKEPGALCHTDSQLAYTSRVVVGGTTSPVSMADCDKLADESRLKKSGTFEFGRYYCAGGSGYIAAFSAALVDDRVVVTYAVVDSWEVGG